MKNLAAVKDEKAGKNAVKVALLLGQEFYQDNQYKFNIQVVGTNIRRGGRPKS